jgi:hypothetical protein
MCGLRSNPGFSESEFRTFCRPNTPDSAECSGFCERTCPVGQRRERFLSGFSQPDPGKLTPFFSG